MIDMSFPHTDLVVELQQHLGRARHLRQHVPSHVAPRWNGARVRTHVGVSLCDVYESEVVR